MAISPMHEAIQQLRSTLLAVEAAGRTDGQLLDDYLGRRDEAALSVLVRRHGPMVWGVCRRVLRDHHDAEDAFQATFLILVRRAGAIASRELLANWLYGVAYKTAVKARATAARRKMRERPMEAMREVSEPQTVERDPWPDLQPLLDRELSRLPDKYRVPVVLCDLQGQTRKEAAETIGCPEGTVAGRLARARAMLAKRLSRHGLTLSAALLAAALSRNAASACVPAAVTAHTIRAATLVAAGHATASGTISVQVAALAGGLNTMTVSKLKLALVLMLAVGVCAGVGAWTQPDGGPAGSAPGQNASKPESGQPRDGIAPPQQKVDEKKGASDLGEPQGKVLRRTDNSVEINLGSDDQLRVGQKFIVLPMDFPEKGRESRMRTFRVPDASGQYQTVERFVPKGKIEVIEVLGPHLSKCRIADETDKIRDGVKPGDLLYHEDIPEEITLASVPPVVLKTVPEAGSAEVDPKLTEIRVTFTKDMKDGCWSWCTLTEGSFPNIDGKPKYLADKRTCVLPVKLEPGKTYAVWVNGEKFTSFMDADGKPAVPYLLVFKTKK